MVCGQSVTPVIKVRDLGVFIDRELADNGSSRGQYTVRGCIYQLRQLRSIKRSLTLDNRRALATAFTTSRVDYCNGVLYGVAKGEVQRLQMVLNAAARLVVGTGKFSHVTISSVMSSTGSLYSIESATRSPYWLGTVFAASARSISVTFALRWLLPLDELACVQRRVAIFWSLEHEQIWANEVSVYLRRRCGTHFRIRSNTLLQAANISGKNWQHTCLGQPIRTSLWELLKSELAYLLTYLLTYLLRSNTVFPQPQLPGYATVRVWLGVFLWPNTGPISFQHFKAGLKYTIDKIHDGRLKELSENPSWWTRHTGTYSAWNYCTRCFHFSPKCTKIVGGWGSRPRWGSLQRSPRPPSCYGLGWRFVTCLVGVNYVPPCSWPVPPCCFEAGYGPDSILIQEIHLSLLANFPFQFSLKRTSSKLLSFPRPLPRLFPIFSPCTVNTDFILAVLISSYTTYNFLYVIHGIMITIIIQFNSIQTFARANL